MLWLVACVSVCSDGTQIVYGLLSTLSILHRDAARERQTCNKYSQHKFTHQDKSESNQSRVVAAVVVVVVLVFSVDLFLVCL